MSLTNRFRRAWDGFRNKTELISSSDPRILDILGATPSAAGVMVDAVSAMRVSAVFAAVSRISGGISTLPCHTYERTWDTKRQAWTRTKVEDADTHWLLNERPSAAWSGASHWERVCQYILLRGDAFTLIRRDGSGRIKDLIPLDWDAVTPMKLTKEIGSRLVYAVNDGLKVQAIDQDDMLHFPGFGFDGLKSMSVISWAAKNAAGNAMAMDEYSGRFFAGGAHPSIVLQTKGKLSESQADLLRDSFAKRHSGITNAHRLPLVLTEGVEAKEVSISATDSQLLEARQFQVIDIARAFGVPPHMIGETSSSTSWGTGIEAMSRAFVQYCLQPHLVRIEQELNSQLFRTPRTSVEVDREASMQSDSVSQSGYFRQALGGPGTGKGWMSVNEIRRIKNLPPKDGQDDIFDPSVLQNGAGTQ